jgi:hypothetical protein
LGQQICTVCCGTKRIAEINCPSDCRYLETSRAHPPASVQRQQERDLRFALPLFQGLTDRQYELLFLIQGFLCTDRPDAPVMGDDDIARAAQAMAQTYETASRGIIYEHSADLPSAARLATDLKALLASKQEQGLRVRETDLGVVFRRVERAARDARRALPGGDRAYVELLKRLLPNAGRAPADSGRAASDEPTGVGDSDLILPGR